MTPPGSPLHILILSDRDWTHPQAGGTGTVLEAEVRRWLDWGHRVTVVTSSYPGAAREERDGALTIHRAGRLRTVVPRTFLRMRRGLVKDADVALEVVNGVFFMTPLWLKVPCVTFVQHLSGGAQYELELGRKGRLLGALLETGPLRFLYGDARFMTVSQPTAEELARRGARAENVVVNHNGIEPHDFAEVAEANEPTLVHLGRLKRYKNIEVVLDVLAELPDATLDLVGDGDHRAALEREIERRGLSGRVHVHGFVSSERKRELLGRAWVNVVSSTAEGWGLSVTEAAACGTPTAALAVGGLRESVDDERTGLLAADAGELTDQVRRLLDDSSLRERLGAAARERARGFTWERTAERALEVLRDERERSRDRPSFLRTLAASDTGRSIGLAAAAMATNIVGLVLTVLFARLLGSDGYGTLAALVSAFLILALPGQALQVAAARQVSSEAASGAWRSAVRRWMRDLTLAAVVLTGVGALLRQPLADLIGVDTEWGAAAVLPSACIWMLLSIQRGVLQGLGSYRLVGLSLIGEAMARLAIGGILIGAGLGPTGGFLGTGLGILAMTLILAGPLHRALEEHHDTGEARRLRDLTRQALVPLLALALLAWLQNVDVIVVKHQALTDDLASSYAAAAVAAKLVIWIGVGLGLFLLPETARRATGGADPRPILLRAVAIAAAVGVPMVAVYSVAGQTVLESAFGSDLALASDALPLLGVAMTLLTCVFLSVQFLLGLSRWTFLPLLALASAVEPALLSIVGPGLTEIALALACLQLVLATAVVGLALRSGRPGPAEPAGPEPAPRAVKVPAD